MNQVIYNTMSNNEEEILELFRMEEELRQRPLCATGIKSHRMGHIPCRP